ncbi:22891_t:CDS:2 [Cetraspora pellucida]|uniref:22891_t:CDS:1 n=1 Tax=Cetraspora pellucida TaxID=1433469 RepID=A0A9N9C076_9GLOM|nr:22891_t:CDS:2 [Cetraspora pellucida]
MANARNDEYFEKFDVNNWSYDEFRKFLTDKKCSETIGINSLKEISKDNNYPIRCQPSIDILADIDHSAITLEIISNFLYRNPASKHNNLKIVKNLQMELDQTLPCKMIRIMESLPRQIRSTMALPN